MKKISIDLLNVTEIEGAPFYKVNQKLSRLPETLKQSITNELYSVSQDTAGMRLRFKTNSGTLGINCIIGEGENFSEASKNRLCGFDLYADGCFLKNIFPSKTGMFESFYWRDIQRKEREIDIYLPLSAPVSDLKIILDDDASILEPRPYAVLSPLVFYGTSITQGYTVSRPGQAYPSQIARKLNVGLVNMGFSGCGRGEALVASAVANVKASCYIIDFGQNCETLREFEQNLTPFVKEISYKNPATPILLTTPVFYLDETTDEDLAKFQKGRRDIVKSTYEQLSKNIDNLHLFSWNEYVPFSSGMCQTDGAHMNDLGAYLMCEAIVPKLCEILSL